MKNTNKKICLVLASLFTVVGCANNTSSDGYVEPSEYIPPVMEGKYIIRDGISDYSIVIPEKPASKLLLAASELEYFLEEATGCELPVISTKEVKRGDKYISLGHTGQFNNAYSGEDFSILDSTYSSYFIDTKDDNIYIASFANGVEAGTLYGVYDLLHSLIDYNYYYEDEFSFTKTENVNLLNYEKHFEIPSFDGRGIGTSYISFHDKHNNRLRLINTYRGQEWTGHLYGHGQIRCYVNPLEKLEDGRTLGEAHPDWFLNPAGTTSNNQLCWTAGEEMEQYIAQKMIGYFQQFPDGKYFMFGQEDNKRGCNCDRCKRAMEEYAGNHAGLQIAIMNNVIEICEKWLSENDPDRYVNYVVYAYYTTKEAPIKETSSGDIIPYSDKVVPHDRLRIMYAPIEGNFAHPITSPINSDVNLILKQWSKVAAGKIIMYLYDTNFHNYFVNFNNFGTVKSMFKTCRDYGVTYMYTQGAMDTNMPCFDEMRAYVESALMWNINKDYETLARDFMNNFYKDVADNMYEVYEIIRDRYAYFQSVSEPASGSIYGDLAVADLWPFASIRKMDELIKKSFKEIEKYRSSDPGKYQTLYDRVMKEYLALIFLKVTLYRSYYTEEEIQEMKVIFETYTVKFGYFSSAEGGNLDGLF